MRPLADTIAIEVGPDTHSVPMGTGVKWRAVETDSLALHSIPIPPPHVGNLPNEDPICGLDIKHIVPLADFVYGYGVAGHTLLHALHVF